MNNWWHSVINYISLQKQYMWILLLVIFILMNVLNLNCHKCQNMSNWLNFQHTYRVKEAIFERLWSRNCDMKHMLLDHGPVRAKISKKDMNFMSTWLKMIKNAIHLEFFQIIQLSHRVAGIDFARLHFLCFFG